MRGARRARPDLPAAAALVRTPNSKRLAASRAHRNAQAAAAGVRGSLGAYREVRDNLSEGLRFYMSLQEAIGTLGQQAGDYALTRRLQRCAPRAAADAGARSRPPSCLLCWSLAGPRAARAGMANEAARAHPPADSAACRPRRRLRPQSGAGGMQPPPARLTARPGAAPGTTCWGTCGVRATRRGARPRRRARVRRRSCPRCTWPPRGRPAAAPSSMAMGRRWATRCACSCGAPVLARPASSARVCTPKKAPFVLPRSMRSGRLLAPTLGASAAAFGSV